MVSYGWLLLPVARAAHTRARASRTTRAGRVDVGAVEGVEEFFVGDVAAVVDTITQNVVNVFARRRVYEHAGALRALGTLTQGAGGAWEAVADAVFDAGEEIVDIRQRLDARHVPAEPVRRHAEAETDQGGHRETDGLQVEVVKQLHANRRHNRRHDVPLAVDKYGR